MKKETIKYYKKIWGEAWDDEDEKLDILFDLLLKVLGSPLEERVNEDSHIQTNK